MSLRLRAVPPARSRGQALVELALMMPLMVGIVTVLFQFGILFIAYLSLVHEMRDVGRFAAVHPDTVDTGLSPLTVPTCANVAAGSLWKQMCNDAPGVIDPNKLTFSVIPGADGQTRDCAGTIGPCPKRVVGTELRLQLRYDASSIIFLPSTFRLGPWLKVGIPTQLPAYDYSVMVEQH